jgi:hypothetical protein
MTIWTTLIPDTLFKLAAGQAHLLCAPAPTDAPFRSLSTHLSDDPRPPFRVACPAPSLFTTTQSQSPIIL